MKIIIVPYGIGAKGLAENMKVKTKEAEKLLDVYMEKNQKIKEFMDRNKDFLCENGYVEGTHGQRLYMKNSKGVNWNIVTGKPFAPKIGRAHV